MHSRACLYVPQPFPYHVLRWPLPELFPQPSAFMARCASIKPRCVPRISSSSNRSLSSQVTTEQERLRCRAVLQGRVRASRTTRRADCTAIHSSQGFHPTWLYGWLMPCCSPHVSSGRFLQSPRRNQVTTTLRICRFLREDYGVMLAMTRKVSQARR